MHKTPFLHSLWVVALLSIINIINAQQLAFPGAEGFGRFTTGGRGGEVYHVTNLNDSGAGSFRDAVSQPYRIVVFDLGGVINISSRIVIKHHVYVAGQTAPGDGITIYGNGIAFNGDSGDDIIRYIRIRMGRNGDSGKDAVAISENQNYIFDHVSISWGRDGTLDVNGSGVDNLTFQDCIVSQGINNSNHSTGGLMQSGKWSIIRSLYIDNKTRNPKARGTHEFINSVLYNWASNGYIMGDTEGLSESNMIGNYFIYGPSSSSGSHITRTTPSFHVYAQDNWVDANKNGMLDGELMTNYKTATVENTAYSYPGVGDLMSAQQALQHVIDNVGASLSRDAVDNFLIDELLSYGTKGQIINTENDNGIPNNVGTVANGTLPADTDQDGMPDQWERERGLNPNVPDDNGDDDQDGYTNIEEYLSCLVGEGDACAFNPKLDCNGELNGTAYLDDCARCVGGNTGIAPCYVDCNGDQDGTATIDDCGICSGGNTGITACAGALQGEDFCSASGVSETDNSGFVDAGYLNLDNQLNSSASWYLYAEANTTANLKVRIANGSDNARGMNVLVNDLQQTNFSGSTTGGWTNWLYENIELELIEGVNKITFEANTSDGGPNIDLIAFDNFNLTATNCNADCNGEIGGNAYFDNCNTCVGGSTGLTACQPDCNGDINGTAYLDDCGVCVEGNTSFQSCKSLIEAEEACSVDGIMTEVSNSGFSGDGYVNTDNSIDATIRWDVETNALTPITLSFRYANGGTTNRDGQLVIDGTAYATISFPPTTDWTTWSTTSLNITLPSEVSTIELKAVTSDGLPNIDALYFSEAIASTSCTITGLRDGEDSPTSIIYPNPTEEMIYFSVSMKWQLITTDGKILDKGAGTQLDLSAYTPGLYFIKILNKVYPIIKK